MRISSKTSRYLILAIVAAGIGVWIWQAAAPRATSGGYTVAVTVPKLSPLAVQGKVAFDAVCAACHGLNAAGTDKGPPLIHNIYNPGHHADEAFFLAAKLGVRSHHWPYGDMPPQPQMTRPQLAAVVRYVRELQAANGIVYQPHNM